MLNSKNIKSLSLVLQFSCSGLLSQKLCHYLNQGRPFE